MLRYRRESPDAAALRDGVKKAFIQLRKQGFFARMDFWCCQTCGWAAAPDGVPNIVFFHQQDGDRIREAGECHLAWQGDAKSIVKAMEDQGLSTEWDGTENNRIRVYIDRMNPEAANQ